MAAVRPWSSVFISGSSIGGSVLGIGMRWRETIVEMAERSTNPSYEKGVLERCVIPIQSIRLLKEVGVNEERLRKVLRPTGAWRYVDLKGDVTSEGRWYSGCPEGEESFHISHGDLKAFLRREFCRFGGSFLWDSTVERMYLSGEGHRTWSVDKTYGPFKDGAMVVGADGVNSVARRSMMQSLKPWLMRPVFTYRTGAGIQEDLSKRLLEPGVDYVVALSKGLVLHIWKPQGDSNKKLAWCCVTPGHSTPNYEGMHAMFRTLIASSESISNQSYDAPLVPSPAMTCPETSRWEMSVIGSAFGVPVDRFQLRGDRAVVEIEEAASLVKALYTQGFRRSYIPTELRKYEGVALSRRIDLMERDLGDMTVLLENREHVGDGSPMTSEAKTV